MQFKEAVISISTNMQAGYSVENAIKNSLPDMKQLYGDNSDMVQELQALVKAIDNSVPVEQPILDLGRRSGIKHIQDFADIFMICKRNGGDMTEIMMNTVMIIGESIDAEREIQTVISSKRLEAKIMNVIPFVLVAYISITSPGFFNPLYGNAAGILIMSTCLLLYLFSIYMERKIMEIGV